MKRHLSHRLFSALLALLVLAASVGLTVQQRTCLQSGYRTSSVVFTAPRHHCPVAELGAEHTRATNNAQLEEACCDVSAHLHKLDAPTPEITWTKLLPAPFVATGWPAPTWPPLPPVLLVAQANAWHAADSSPLRSGRTLLRYIGVLVV